MVFITEVVFAEASVGMSSAEALRFALDELGIEDLHADDNELFAAGQVYKEYRRSKGLGKKDGVLPDFMIGAVASGKKVALITLNDRDFVNKFDDLTVINPLQKT